MSISKVIRYTTHPDRAEENAELISAVFAELAADQPQGLQYTSYRLEDGVSFMHIVTMDAEPSALNKSAAFAKFQAGIGERCAIAPVASDATIVGTYRG